MQDLTDSFHVLALGTIVVPALAALTVGLRVVLVRAPRERTTALVSGGAALLSWLLSVALTLRHAGAGARTLDYGAWFGVDGYACEVTFLVDRLSLMMLVLTGSIVGLVARFSVRYLHREHGFHRFFLLLSTFSAGMSLLVLSGSYDLLFAGWEMVGMASMLLIGFYDHRRGAQAGALRAMISYRIADVGLLFAGVMLHQFYGSAEFHTAFDPRSHLEAGAPASAATWIMLALLLAVMGKSAQFPLSGWLPRAMEGPTPSSALFYGALSVHAGVYLLLRSAPLLERSPTASIAVGVVGGLSALLATLSGRTQTDVKNILAYATITQVGLMLVGLSLHLWTWVMVHMCAHAVLRLFQLLRAPSMLRDAQELSAALRRFPRARPGMGVYLLPAPMISRLYFLARSRFFVDALLDRVFVAPLLKLAGRLDQLERIVVDGMPDQRDSVPELSPTPLSRGVR